MTLTDLLPWIAALFGLAFAYPWTRWLLDLPYADDEVRPRQSVLILILTVGLSLGALSWLMMVLAALSSSLLTFGAVTVLALLLSGIGWGVWLRRKRGIVPFPKTAQVAERSGPSARRLAAWVTVAIILGISGLIVFNAAFWPFLEDDTVTLYGPTAFRIATTGQLTPPSYTRGAYDSYPPLVPLAFAYPQLAAGAPHEYAARFIVAVLAVGVVGMAYVLGRELFNHETGVLAAFLVVTTPILTHWAASGYTDLPAGTYYTLAAFFAWRSFKRPHPVYAALVGVMAGLAVFTKNGAWLLVGALVGWIIYSHWVTRREASTGGRAISLRHILLMGGAFLVVAGPWYTHVWQTFGYLVPPTGWTDLADHNPLLLIGPATIFSHFALSGAVVEIGLLLTLLALWRSRWTFAPRLALVIGFSVPFLLVWWWGYSYDYRFLLMIWAFYGVMGADWLLRGFRYLSPGAQTLILRGLPVIVVLLALPAGMMAVDNKPELLRNPFMNDLERHRAQLGPRYDLVLWLRDTVPTEDWILVTDYHMVYHLQQTHPYTTFRAAQEVEYVQQFNFWVLGPGIALPDWANDETVRFVREESGYRVYEILNDEF